MLTSVDQILMVQKVPRTQGYDWCIGPATCRKSAGQGAGLCLMGSLAIGRVSDPFLH